MLEPRSLELFNECRFLGINKKNLLALVVALDVHYKPANRGGLSIAFVSHDRLAGLHKEFCSDPTQTDVITFPSMEEDSFGELCVSAQAAVNYASKHGGAPEEELSRYVIHGYLHLLGYDDLNPKAKRKMRQQEKLCLGLANGIGRIFSFKDDK